MEHLGYLSLLSKVLQELENHFDIKEKVVAEFLIEMAKKSKSVKIYQKRLKKKGINFDRGFIENLYKMIRLMSSSNRVSSNNEIVPPPPVGNVLGEGHGVVEAKKQAFPGLALPNRPQKREDDMIKKKDERKRRANGRLMINEIYKAKVTGVQPYGFFARIQEDSDRVRVRERPEGLCHISEIREERIHAEDIPTYVGRDDMVFVKIIHVVGARISLSMKEVDQKSGQDLFERPLYEIGEKMKLPFEEEEGGDDMLKKKKKSSSSKSDIRNRIVYDFDEDVNDDDENENMNKRPEQEITEYEIFNLQQLAKSGVIPRRHIPELDIDYNKHLKKVSAGAPELDYDIEIKEKLPTFLKINRDQDAEDEEEVELESDEKGEKKQAGSEFMKPPQRNFFEPTPIIKAPEGSMVRAARESAQLAYERKELREQQKRGFLPRRERRGGASTSILPPPIEEQQAAQPKKFGMARGRRGRMMNDEDMPEWRKHVFTGSYGKITTKPLEQQREGLPIFKYRNHILQSVKNNQVLIIVGETGSGKTTQIPQYLAEVGYTQAGLRIGVTQPRRVAAVSVAKRVAEEVGCRVGQEVGYTIRFEDRTTRETRIKYMTDGMLLREALVDPLLRKYKAIMLDEAHERQLQTDVLFGICKGILPRRPDLKLIIASATLDAKKFSLFFNKCPVFSIPGRTYEVEILYAKEPETDYLEAAMLTVMQIHLTEPPGDILLFLTGQEEIDTACETLFDRVKSMGSDVPDLIILPIYSALPSEIQSRIFEKTPEGSRKVVIATNIAETSITIDGIYYVVDPGFVKQNYYNPKTGMESLMVVPISQAQADQRKGRAGRTGPGKCFRLYTEEAFHTELLATMVPDIQRTNLGNTVLLLKAMGINDLLGFQFMDPPSPQQLVNAMERLYHLGALDDDGFLTPLGKKMAEFPLEPQMCKCLIASAEEFGCSEEVLTIVSMLSSENIFYRPREKMEEADKAKRRFHQIEGDHLTLLAVYRAWAQHNFGSQWAFDNFLQNRSLRRAQEVRKQLLGIMDRRGLKVKSAGKDYSRIRKAICSGYFVHAAKRDYKEGYKTAVEGTPVYIHPSSALFGRNPEWVVYHSLVMTSREYMRDVMQINPKWLVDLAPNFFMKAAKTGSRRKRGERLEPLFDSRLDDQDEWRISKRRRIR